MRLYALYASGKGFVRPTVIRISVGTWTVVGPGFLWLGEDVHSWDEAMTLVASRRVQPEPFEV